MSDAEDDTKKVTSDFTQLQVKLKKREVKKAWLWWKKAIKVSSRDTSAKVLEITAGLLDDIEK